MEITIKINGRMAAVEVSAEVAECIDAGRRKAENLSNERRRHWGEREFDEYIVAAEGCLPCQYTPEDLACQQETLDEIVSVLDTCTPHPAGAVLLFALDGYTYTEISRMCNSSRVAVYQSIKGCFDNVDHHVLVDILRRRIKDEHFIGLIWIEPRKDCVKENKRHPISQESEQEINLIAKPPVPDKGSLFGSGRYHGRHKGHSGCVDRRA